MPTMKGTKRLFKGSRAISREIDARDHKDLSLKGTYLPASGRLERVSGPAPTKMKAMAYTDAALRQAGRGSSFRIPEEVSAVSVPAMRDAARLRGKSTKKAVGGKVSSYAKGGSVTRADGCVSKGRTKGRMV